MRLRASHSVHPPSMTASESRPRCCQNAGMDINKKGTEAGEKKVCLCHLAADVLILLTLQL